MKFIPASGADISDLEMLASRLVGTLDGLRAHIIEMGLEVYDEVGLLDDLENGGLITSCNDCGIWEYPKHLDDGLCYVCVEGLEEDIRVEIEDENQFFGFEDDDFDDDAMIFDEEFGIFKFDETDDEEDL